MSDSRSVSTSEDLSTESCETMVSKIRSLITEDRIFTARSLVREASRRFPDHDEIRRLATVLEPGQARREHRPDSGQHDNLRWIAEHQDDYRGQWIAVLDGQMIAAESDLPSLLASLRQIQPHREPLIHHVR